MNDLVEKILSENYVEASEIFENRLNDLVEKKLYEKKRMMQAESSFPGGTAGVQARRAAGFQKATDVLGDPSRETEKTSDKEKGDKATLAAMGKQARPLGLPVDRSVRYSKSYVAGSETEKRARALADRGSQAAKKWLKRTKTTRNVLGAIKSVGGVGKRILQGLGEENT